jgi:hypothetical protein
VLPASRNFFSSQQFYSTAIMLLFTITVIFKVFCTFNESPSLCPTCRLLSLSATAEYQTAHLGEWSSTVLFYYYYCIHRKISAMLTSDWPNRVYADNHHVYHVGIFVSANLASMLTRNQTFLGTTSEPAIGK